MYIIFPILLTVILAYLISASQQKKNAAHLLTLPDNYKALLQQYVAYYRALNDGQKKKFEGRITAFLSSITIEGINTEVEDIDKVLVAASAVIPIFGFTHWQYSNLTNVLLYPEHFNEAFEQQGDERRVMGMVGSGAMNHKMILSRPALREGFMNETDRNNTAIHEFVHLLDKMDGDTDGIPEALLQKQYTIPWINLMHEEIHKIMQNKSDINPYGATSKTEFFAVAAEYFFERPQLLKDRHPALFDLMKEIFDQTPAVQTKAKENKIGRNDPCPCGSGEKYKFCHGDE